MKKLYTLVMLMAFSLGAIAQVNVTFQVDMSNEVVSADGVHCAGSWQAAAGFPGDWDPATAELLDADGDGVYTLTVQLPAGTYQYKFVNGNAWGSDEGVPSACAVSNNREVVIGTTDLTISTVCFGSCSPCPGGPIPTYNITFEVDMSTTCDVDSVDIAGDMNSWSGGDMLDDSDGDGIYSITLPIDSGEVQYKFRRYFNGSANWEGIGNRIHNSMMDATVPYTCYNDTAACAAVPAPADVTFRVDMTNEAPDASGVYIIGDFTSPSWQDGAIQLMPDAANPGFYEATFNMCPGTFYWKFVNGDPDPNSSVVEVEESFPGGDTSCYVENGIGGFNRVNTRMDDQPMLLAYVFNTCDAAGIGLEDGLNMRDFSVYPNPVNGVSTLDLGIEEKFNVSVYDMSGRLVMDYGKRYGELQIDGTQLESGVYIITIARDNGEMTQSRFIVQ
jgi:hypothetical protein